MVQWGWWSQTWEPAQWRFCKSAAMLRRLCDEVRKPSYSTRIFFNLLLVTLWLFPNAIRFVSRYVWNITPYSYQIILSLTLGMSTWCSLIDQWCLHRQHVNSIWHPAVVSINPSDQTTTQCTHTAAVLHEQAEPLWCLPPLYKWNVVPT